ncbi:MAG: hypothetical protein J0I06_18145 [Planctomycetes bacterium]|nr:hypothetical protein [Planctomycetota bacterium]
MVSLSWPRLFLCFGALICPRSGAAAGGPFEPTEDYYGAKGRVKVAWEVPRATVIEGHDLVATLVVTGATNPTEVEKPDLTKLKAFDVFTVTNVADPPRTPDDKVVRFGYKLRPRNRAVDRVPALKFRYFNRAAAEGKQFPSTYAESVAIAVTEPPPPVPVPMTEPDRLFSVATGPDVLNGPFVPCAWAWGAAALFGPLAALGWFLAWRRVYPNGHRLAQMRRSRAARRATDAIRRAGRTPDPPAAIASAVLGYLRTRYPLPESAATPSEIAAALAESKVPPEEAERVADVFRGCDRARFAPPSDSGSSLAADAEAALARLEELA